MRDPAGVTGGLNLYEYVLANPVVAADFLGLMTDDLWGDLVAALHKAHVAQNAWREKRRQACRATAAVWAGVVQTALDAQQQRLEAAAIVVGAAAAGATLTWPGAAWKAYVLIGSLGFSYTLITGRDLGLDGHNSFIGLYKWHNKKKMSEMEYYAERHEEVVQALVRDRNECDNRWAPLEWDPPERPENDGCGTVSRVTVHGNLVAEAAPLGIGLLAILLWWLRKRRLVFRFVSWTVRWRLMQKRYYM